MGQAHSRWIPIRENEPVEIPKGLLEYFDIFHPNESAGQNGRLAVLANREYPEATKSPQLYHLAFTEKDFTSDVLSIVRSTELEAIVSLFERLLQFPELYSFPNVLRMFRNSRVQNPYKLNFPLWSDWKKKYAEYDPSNSEIDGKDNFPLHGFVRGGPLNQVVDLAVRMSDINWRNTQGNTLLHIAVLWQNLSLVRFLLCLGADPNIQNNKGQTPLHFSSPMHHKIDFIDFCFFSQGVFLTVATEPKDTAEIVKSLLLAGARRCDKEFQGCSDDCRKGGDSNDDAMECVLKKQTETECSAKQHHDDWNDKLIKEVISSCRSWSFFGIPFRSRASNVISALSLDGGGVKGLVLVQVLIALEERLSDPIMDYLDWVAGTSTGSIVAAALGEGKSLREIQRIYMRLKDKVFQKGVLPKFNSFDSSVLESFLQESLGNEKTLLEIEYPKMFFTTLKSDKNPGELVLQRTYRLPESNKVNETLQYDDPTETTLWRAVRRSSAAPTYFSPSEGIYLDGGMAANNPSMDLLSEIHRWNKHTQKTKGQVIPGCLISIGCGAPPQSELQWSLVSSPFDIAKVVFTQVAPTDGSIVNNAREQAHAAKIPFFRLTPKLSEDVDLASNDNRKVLPMMWDAFVFTRTHGKELDEIAELLKIIGKNRSRKKDLDWKAANRIMNEKTEPSMI